MSRADLAEAWNLVRTRQIAPALEIIQNALDADPSDLSAAILKIKTLRVDAQFDEALAAIEQAKSLADQANLESAHAELAFEHGFLLQARGKQEDALALFRDAAAVDEPRIDYLGAVCSVLCQLDRDAEAIEWRTRILRLRDEEVRCAPSEIVNSERPKSFDPNARGRNIISYCLFGDDPFYHECAITNARMSEVMFPEFTARFYCAPDLPDAVLRALRSTGAQVMISKSTEDQKISPMAGTFWRFLSFDDPGVDVVLCRDVDSPVLPRERAAIDMWLDSDKPFYCMRDHAVHAELILAGMWGGFTGLLPPIGPLASGTVSEDYSRFSDQRFLRNVIWPRLREGAIMQIDSIPSLDGSVDFPNGYPKYGRQHVGVAWTRKQIFGHQ